MFDLPESAVYQRKMRPLLALLAGPAGKDEQ
jgi:hypothetical protein